MNSPSRQPSDPARLAAPPAEYDRPNQPWVCGHACVGTPCALGPSLRGACQATDECAPRRVGDRWFCNRSSLRGGPCEVGPTPEGNCGCAAVKCMPRRSWRSLRRRFTLACFALALGAAWWGLATSSRNELLAPGPLAAPHAQLLNRAGTERCQACHFAADFGATEWSQQTFGILRPTQPGFTDSDTKVVSHGSIQRQSTKCMACHQNSFPLATALEPHGVARTKLQPSTQEIMERMGTRVDAHTVPQHLQHDLECSFCHQEHHGRDAKLSIMSDRQCQVCHAVQFASLADGHPEFRSWPYAKFPRIAFDHVRHRATHYAKSNRKFDCNDCHRSESSRDIVAVAPYEDACASCHDQSLVQSQSLGITVLGLPMLDTEHLREVGHELGQWPSLAGGDYDGRLPAILRFLLSADPQAASALDEFPPDFDWLDLDRANTTQVTATAEVAWGIKRLFAEVATEGQPALRRRIEQVVQRPLKEAEYQAAVAQLPWDLLAVAQRQWFPNLSEELNARQDVGSFIEADEPSATSPLDPPTHPDPLAANQVPAGGWYRDPAVVAIGYRPTGHRDPFVKAWIDLIDEVDRAGKKHDRLLGEFMKATSASQCASCHVVLDDREGTTDEAGSTSATSIAGTSAPQLPPEISSRAAGDPKILWQAKPLPQRSIGFTWFSHEPHLVLPELIDCQPCHVLAERQLGSSGLAAGDAAFQRIEADFQTLSKDQCATCHTAHSAGDACIQCHRYHATR